MCCRRWVFSNFKPSQCANFTWTCQIGLFGCVCFFLQNSRNFDALLPVLNLHLRLPRGLIQTLLSCLILVFSSSTFMASFCPNRCLVLYSVSVLMMAYIELVLNVLMRGAWEVLCSFSLGSAWLILSPTWFSLICFACIIWIDNNLRHLDLCLLCLRWVATYKFI